MSNGDKKYDRTYLLSVARTIYSHSNALSVQQRITTIYRPLYTPFDIILSLISAHSRLLDIGCGTGTFLLIAQYLLDLGESYGFDRNLKSIEIAQSANIYPNIHFIHNDANLGAIIGNSNIVTCIDLLHHIPTQERNSFLDTLFENMRTGQDIIVKDLDPLPVWKAFANKVTDYLSTRSRVSYIGLNELRISMVKKGFKVRIAQRLDKHIWNHYIIVARKI